MEIYDKYLTRLKEVLDLFNSMVMTEYGNVETVDVQNKQKETVLKCGKLMMFKEVTLWFENDFDNGIEDGLYAYIKDQIKDINRICRLASEELKSLNIDQQVRSKLDCLGRIDGCNEIISMMNESSRKK